VSALPFGMSLYFLLIKNKVPRFAVFTVPLPFSSFSSNHLSTTGFHVYQSYILSKCDTMVLCLRENNHTLRLQPLYAGVNNYHDLPARHEKSRNVEY